MPPEWPVVLLTTMAIGGAKVTHRDGCAPRHLHLFLAELPAQTLAQEKEFLSMREDTLYQTQLELPKLQLLGFMHRPNSISK